MIIEHCAEMQGW